MTLNLAFLQENTDTYNMNNTVSALSAVADATAFSSREAEVGGTDTKQAGKER